MREILLRGKRIDNGDWVTSGNLITFNDEGEGKMFFIPEQNAKCTCTHDDQDNILSFNSGVFYKVDPKTMGQYTGKTARDGVKIFEGDIVKANVIQNTGREVFKYTGIYVVTYHPDYCYFYLKREGNNLLFDRNWSYGVFIEEVVGNIHDNPELKEEVQK